MSGPGRWTTVVVGLAALGAIAAPLAAQVPSISATSPQAAVPGGTLDVTLRGGNLAGASQLWTSFVSEAVLSPDVENNGQNAAEVVYRVTVPPEVPAGVYGIRVAAPGGVSPLRLFLVDDLPSVKAEGDITAPEQAQALSLPCAVDAAVPAVMRHYYKFSVEAGQRVSFEVLARRLGSPMDPMLRILDGNGRELNYSDDVPGLSSDAQLSHTFEAAGEYLVEVSDIRYQGGGNYFYRLRVGDFPCVSASYPLGAGRGAEIALSFAGADVDGVEPLIVRTPSDPLVNSIPVAVRRAGGQSSGMAVLMLSDRDEFVESEPNNTPEQPNRFSLGGYWNGRIDQPGDVDRFVFTASKGQSFQFTARTRDLASPTDLVLTLLNADGGKVAEVDDTGTTDGVLSYTFPADGDYTLLAEDLHGRGGGRFVYRISVDESRPGFSLAASSDLLNIEAGGTALITVQAVRSGYNGPIHLDVVNLPDKVTAVPTVIGPGRNSAVLTVHGAADAAAGQVHPVRIVGTARLGDTDFQATASITAALSPQFNNMPWPPWGLAQASAVGIGPPPKFVLRTEPAEIVFGKHLKATVKIVADRQEGFNEAIALAVTPEKDGLPPDVSAALASIEQDKNEVEIVFTAGEKAPLGAFTGVLVGTLTKDKANYTQSVPGIELRVDEAFQLTAQPVEPTLKRGGQLAVKITAARNPAYSGPIAFKVENLPQGVTAAEATLPADSDTIEVVLSASQEAAAAQLENLVVRGEATVDKATLTAASSAIKLTIE